MRGSDVRVHVIGSQTYATLIESAATDYRYAQGQSGSDAILKPIDLPAAVAKACVDLALVLDLPFAGIDLRLTKADEVVCFEVNPSPAYSYTSPHGCAHRGCARPLVGRGGTAGAVPDLMEPLAVPSNRERPHGRSRFTEHISAERDVLYLTSTICQ